jgi:hypothetical protein
MFVATIVVSLTLEGGAGRFGGCGSQVVSEWLTQQAGDTHQGLRRQEQPSAVLC